MNFFLPEKKTVVSSGCSDLQPLEGETTGSVLPHDRHAHREILYVLQGLSTQFFWGREYLSEPGTAFFIDEWELHSFGYRREDDDLLHLWLSPGPERITAHILHVRHGSYSVHTRFFPLGEEISRVVMRRWNDAVHLAIPESERLAIQRLNLNLILQELALQTTRSSPESEPSRGAAGIIPFLRTYIEQVHGRGCSLAHLEKLTGYSRFYLAHLFKRQTGSSIGSYLDQVRGQFLLAGLRRGLSQKEIAEELGFSSPSAFCAWKRSQKPVPESPGLLR